MNGGGSDARGAVQNNGFRRRATTRGSVCYPKFSTLDAPEPIARRSRVIGVNVVNRSGFDGGGDDRLELREWAIRMALKARDDTASTGSHGSPAHRGASQVWT